MERTTASLSGGEQQLLSLAAAMTGSPRVLLLDEPCAALDPAAEEKFLQVPLRLNRELGRNGADEYPYPRRSFGTGGRRAVAPCRALHLL